MSIYRRKFKTEDGKVKRSKSYTAEFTYRGQLYRRGKFLDRATAEHWARTTQLKLSRGEVGMVKPLMASQVLPLIDKFAEYLKGLGRDDMYVYTTRRRLKRLAEDCAWVTLGDVTMPSFDRWRNAKPKWRGKAIAAKTLNQYLDTAGEWAKWLVSEQFFAVNPFVSMRKQSAQGNDRYRRAATLEEINLLLAHADESRRLQYIFRLYVPIRRRAVGAITWGDLHLDADRPWGEIPSWANKSRRREKFAIRLDLAQQLRRAKASVKAVADDRVFPELLTVDDLKADLAKAGVPFSDNKGNRRLDFHAFRRTFIKLAKAAGVPMEDAHHALHHKSVATTRKWYDDDAVETPLTNAVERLPAVGEVRLA